MMNCSLVRILSCLQGDALFAFGIKEIAEGALFQWFFGGVKGLWWLAELLYSRIIMILCLILFLEVGVFFRGFVGKIGVCPALVSV